MSWNFVHLGYLSYIYLYTLPCRLCEPLQTAGQFTPTPLALDDPSGYGSNADH